MNIKLVVTILVVNYGSLFAHELTIEPSAPIPTLVKNLANKRFIHQLDKILDRPTEAKTRLIPLKEPPTESTPWMLYIITTPSMSEHSVAHVLLYCERINELGALEIWAVDFLPAPWLDHEHVVPAFIYSDLAQYPLEGKVRLATHAKKMGTNVVKQLKRYEPTTWHIHGQPVSDELMGTLIQEAEGFALAPPNFAFVPYNDNMSNCENFIRRLLERAGFLNQQDFSGSLFFGIEALLWETFYFAEDCV